MFDSEYLLKAKDAAVAAVRPLRERLLQGYGSISNDFKADSTVVTELDLWAEQQIKDALKKFNPDFGFLGEENGAEGSEKTRWVIDPIDGTEHFIRGIPFCCNMVALVDGKDLLVGVIYNFITDELYWAAKGQGAWLGDIRLHISTRPLQQSLVNLSVNHANPEAKELIDNILSKVRSYVKFECSGYSNCLVASGKIEGRIVTQGKGGPWDYAAGAILVSEAGGKVEHWGKRDYDYMNTSSQVSGSPAVVEMARELAIS